MKLNYNIHTVCRYKSNLATQIRWLLWRNLKGITRESISSKILVLQSIVKKNFAFFSLIK
jgi:hypothetical protein